MVRAPRTGVPIYLQDVSGCGVVLMRIACSERMETTSFSVMAAATRPTAAAETTCCSAGMATTSWKATVERQDRRR